MYVVSASTPKQDWDFGKGRVKSPKLLKGEQVEINDNWVLDQNCSKCGKYISTSPDFGHIQMEKNYMYKSEIQTNQTKKIDCFIPKSNLSLCRNLDFHLSSFWTLLNENIICLKSGLTGQKTRPLYKQDRFKDCCKTWAFTAL